MHIVRLPGEYVRIYIGIVAALHASRASSLRHGSRLPSSANYCFLLIFTSAACISGYGRYSLDLSWPSTPNIARTRHAQTMTNCDNKSRVAVEDGGIGKYCSG